MKQQPDHAHCGLELARRLVHLLLPCLLLVASFMTWPCLGGPVLLFNETFATKTPDSRLQWMNKPSTWESGKGVLRVQADKGADWWRLSYYNPPYLSESGHILGYKSAEDVVVETSFSLDHMSQFDQAGLMLHSDNQHWIKVGVEYADGTTRLSSVITNNYSQWAVQDWPHSPITIRLYKLGTDVVAEVYHPVKREWQFFFIGRVEGMQSATIGAHIASPVDKAGWAEFSYLSVSKCPTDGQKCFHHNADDIQANDEL